MAERGRHSAAHRGCYEQASEPMRHHPYPEQPERLRPPDRLEREITAQAADIDRITLVNRRLAVSHVARREELVSTQREIQKVKARFRSIDTESDIQIRVLLDKIAKMEADIKRGESLKKELHQAHLEAQTLVKARVELTSKIQQASEELQKLRPDAKVLPDLNNELEKSKQELQRLRAKFECKKGSNIVQAEELKAMERKLIGMVRQIEKLRSDVSNAKNQALAVGSQPPGPHPPPLNPVGGSYFDEFGRPFGQMGFHPSGGPMMPYISSNGPIAHPGPYASSFSNGPTTHPSLHDLSFSNALTAHPVPYDSSFSNGPVAPPVAYDASVVQR